jgi:hypothetical protein
MDKPPELPPELSEDGGKKLTEAEIQELLRPSLRNWRRQKAARAALSLAGASRAIAQTELRRESAKAVQESWPRDSYHLEQVLWPSLSKYSETVFDEIAEVRLAELGSKFLVRRYTHWLKCTGVSAVVDEDVCLPMGEGQFYVTVQHVIGVIGDSKWPRQIEETKRALFGMLTELIGGHHTENLEKRLRVHLNGLIARWEGEAIRQTSSPPASETNAVVTLIAANAVEIAIPGPSDDTAPKAVEAASAQPGTVATDGKGEPPWKTVEICFLDAEYVQVTALGQVKRLSYAEMGFGDRRGMKVGDRGPNKAWGWLRTFAEKRGTIDLPERQSAPAPKGSWDGDRQPKSSHEVLIAERAGAAKARAKLQVAMKDLRRSLCSHFAIKDNPILFEGTCYRVQFRIGCSPSYHQ